MQPIIPKHWENPDRTVSHHRTALNFVLDAHHEHATQEEGIFGDVIRVYNLGVS